jgi:hypothetical protein
VVGRREDLFLMTNEIICGSFKVGPDGYEIPYKFDLQSLPLSERDREWIETMEWLRVFMSFRLLSWRKEAK